MIKTYEELIQVLTIENQEWEKDILRRWIERDGLKKVNEEVEELMERIKNGEVKN